MPDTVLVYQGYTRQVTMTTIKVDSDLRDRLNAEARRQGTTAGSFVERLFESWLREQRFTAIREALAHGDATDEGLAFDQALLDGLPGETE